MKILIWISFALIQAFLIRLSLLKVANHIAFGLHQSGMGFIERHPSPWNWFYEAILLGHEEGLRSEARLTSFFILGLYHLIVVSGKHVTALDHLTSRLFFFLPEKYRKALTAVMLIVFCFFNRLQSSCARAVIQWFLLGKKKFTPLLEGDLQVIVTCVSLLIAPEWAHSLSFQISSGATLALAIASSCRPRKKPLRKVFTTLCCVVITAPLIFCVQPCFSWLIIPANLFAIPFFEIVLLPLSLLNVFIYILAPFSEKIFAVIFALSDQLAQFQRPLLCFDERNQRSWGLLYLAVIYMAWRFSLPLLIRKRFWRNQLHHHA